MGFTTADYMAMNARLQKPTKDALVARAIAREHDLHDAILAECRRRGWLAFHCRMDKPTRATLGQPDFIIVTDCGVLFVEAKTKTGKLSPAQQAIAAWLKKLGRRFYVVRSLKDFLEAIE